MIDGSHHSNPVGLDKSLKGEDSLKRKLATALDPDTDLTPTDVLKGMKDSVRYTMATPPEHYTGAVQHAIHEMQSRGFENVKLPDYHHAWGNPDGYKGLNTAWRDPETGQVFELQFHTPGSFDAKEAAHPIYERIRTLNPLLDADEIDRLQAQAAEIFRQVEVPPGVESIKLD